MKQRIPLGPRQDFPVAHIRLIKLAPLPDEPLREALVFHDKEGRFRAYRNLCKHIPLLLDTFADSFDAPRNGCIECRTHGARYRLDDGLCVLGPCMGESLDQLDIEEQEGQLYLLDPMK